MIFNLLIKICKETVFLQAQERPATLILTLTSTFCIARVRQVYNRDTETGSWNFVVPLRMIRMRKMCQSQQFVTWARDTGCRLPSYAGRPGHMEDQSPDQSVCPSFCCSGSNFRWKKIKNPAVVKKVFSTRTWGWNIYKFIFAGIVNEMTFCQISDYATRAEQNLFTNTDSEGMTL